MKRAVIYARVGILPAGNTALTDQLSVCRAYCRRWGLTVTAEYVDEGFSGGYIDRPAYSNMVAAALHEQRDFEAIVVMDRVRLLTDARFCHVIENLFRTNGVALRPVSPDTVTIPSEVDGDMPCDLQRSTHLPDTDSLSA